jgi:hypothetical protein
VVSVVAKLTRLFATVAFGPKVHLVVSAVLNGSTRDASGG